MKRSSGVTAVAILVAIAGLLAVVAVGYLWWHPNADDFLGDADFQGAPISTSPLSAGSQSTYNGFLTLTNLDRTLVAALVPTGFQLAPNVSFWNQNKHPVLVLYGDQTDGATFLGSVVVPAPPIDRGHYSEAILAIPYVQRTGGTGGWHTYIVRMYLDNAAAVAGGTIFGYAKQLGCLDWRGAIVKIWQQPVVCPAPPPYSLVTRSLLEGSLRFDGSWYDGTVAHNHIPNLADMIGMVTTKILGKSYSGASICSFFEWSLDDARVAKATATHVFQSPWRSSNMGAWPGLGNLANVNDGAVALRGVRWRLGAPTACGFP